MVKATTIYECEICGEEYTTLAEAEQCEAQGKVENPYPVGMMFAKRENGVPYAIVKLSKGHNKVLYACRVGINKVAHADVIEFGTIPHDCKLFPPHKHTKAYNTIKEYLIVQGVNPVDYSIENNKE